MLLGHLNDYILLAKKECDFLIIGITNSDPLHIIENTKNPHRSKQVNNPLSYYERLLMIRDSLLDAGLGLHQFDIVPFPINIPQIISYYVPNDAVHYLTVFDDWGHEKVTTLLRQNYNVVVLYEKTESEKKISSTMVRNLILQKGHWELLVPNAVTKHILSIPLRDRLLALVNLSAEGDDLSF